MIENQPSGLKWVDFGLLFSKSDQKLVFVGSLFFELWTLQVQWVRSMAVKGFLGKRAKSIISMRLPIRFRARNWTERLPVRFDRLASAA